MSRTLCFPTQREVKLMSWCATHTRQPKTGHSVDSSRHVTSRYPSIGLKNFKGPWRVSGSHGRDLKAVHSVPFEVWKPAEPQSITCMLYLKSPKPLSSLQSFSASRIECTIPSMQQREKESERESMVNLTLSESELTCH